MPGGPISTGVLTWSSEVLEPEAEGGWVQHKHLCTPREVYVRHTCHILLPISTLRKDGFAPGEAENKGRCGELADRGNVLRYSTVRCKESRAEDAARRHCGRPSECCGWRTGRWGAVR